jgi:hypothetical protein
VSVITRKGIRKKKLVIVALATKNSSITTKGANPISLVAHPYGDWKNFICHKRQPKWDKVCQLKVYIHNPTIIIFQMTTELFQSPQKKGCHMFLEFFCWESLRGFQKKCQLFLATKIFWLPSKKLWWLDGDHIFLSCPSLWGAKTRKKACM